MPQKTLALIAGLALLAAVAFLAGSALWSSDEIPVVTWSADDEVELPPDPSEDAELPVGEAPRRTERIAGGESPGATETADRMAMRLHGRVVDAFAAPVSGARVWLEFGRGGPRDRGGRARAVPDPVVTGADGGFAFQGELFRNLRVVLHVLHADFAPGQFDRDLGEGRADLPLGDLVLQRGGIVRGRVTDLGGFAIPGAEVQLQPEGRNPLRWMRNREQVLSPLASDRNGGFTFAHVAAGEWRVTAVAKGHQHGQSAQFEAADGVAVDLEDIRLGPGHELSGFVRDIGGRPIAAAEVTLRQGRGRDFRARTDAAGRFRLEHLPATAMRLAVQQDGYLEHEQEGVDPSQHTLPLQITLQDGLQIRGRVTDAVTGQPVTHFAVRAQRVRGLPRSEAADAERAIAAVLEELRRSGADSATMQAHMEEVRRRFGEQAARAPGRRGPGERDGGGAAWTWNADVGRPGQHPDGRFAATGLQEGVYRVLVHSPEHMRWSSAELELRLGAPAPDLAIALERGLAVRGSVVDAADRPVAGARVELRSVDDNGGAGPERDGGRDGVRQLARQWFASGIAVAEARTDAAGRFALEHAPAGRFRVTAAAQGHDTDASEPFDLTADVAGLRLVLGALGELAGTVLGLPPERAAEARVFAMQLQARVGVLRGLRPMVPVAADGTYRFEDLAPGPYLVRAFVGSPAEVMRELMGGPGGSVPSADVVVRAGERAQLDVRVELPQTGTVAGTVTDNGQPAAGYRVALQPADGNTPEAPFGRTWRRLDDTTDPAGRYSVRDVPAGSYQLTVSRERQGLPLLRQPVFVVADGETALDLPVASGRIRGTVTGPEGGAVLQGTAWFLPGLTEPPADLAAWRRTNPTANARLQSGSFASAALPPGSYLVVVHAPGRAPTSAIASVAAGTEAQVVLAIGAPDAGASPGGNGSPGPPSPGGNNRRGRD